MGGDFPKVGCPGLVELEALEARVVDCVDTAAQVASLLAEAARPVQNRFTTDLKSFKKTGIKIADSVIFSRCYRRFSFCEIRCVLTL